jgi:hypothetical protein
LWGLFSKRVIEGKGLNEKNTKLMNWYGPAMHKIESLGTQKGTLRVYGPR